MPSPRYWREIPQRYRLEAVRCRDCETVTYPPRRLCPQCRGEAMEPTNLSRRGRVVTSTVVHVGPDDLAMQTPYAMAIVETPEKARLMVQVVDCDPHDVLPELEVALEFRLIRTEGRAGIRCYGYKGVPLGR